MLVLAGANAVSGQNRPARPEPSPASQLANPPSAEAPAPPASPQATVRLQFPNSDVVDVLHLYEQLTGKKLVMDNFVQGKDNIFIAKDVSREEAIKIIEMSMSLNGISLVPSGRDLISVVGAGENPRKAQVPIVDDRFRFIGYPAGKSGDQLSVPTAVCGPPGTATSLDGLFSGKLGDDQYSRLAESVRSSRNAKRRHHSAAGQRD